MAGKWFTLFCGPIKEKVLSSTCFQISLVFLRKSSLSSGSLKSTLEVLIICSFTRYPKWPIKTYPSSSTSTEQLPVIMIFFFWILINEISNISDPNLEHLAFCGVIHHHQLQRLIHCTLPTWEISFPRCGMPKRRSSMWCQHAASRRSKTNE